MKRHLLTIAALSVSLLGGALAPTLNADQSNKKTVLTVNQPIEVQGTVLNPGQYVLKTLDSPSSRYIVQIFNGDATQLVTTILAIPAYRLEPTGDTRFTFYEMSTGGPRALHTWFYPGDNFGVEFRASQNTTTAKSAPRISEPSAVASTGGQD
jgi:hypothetical protein